MPAHHTHPNCQPYAGRFIFVNLYQDLLLNLSTFFRTSQTTHFPKPRLTAYYLSLPKRDLEDIGFEIFEELIEMSHHGTSQILKDFRVKKSYEPYNISDCKFYEFNTEYMFEHVDIEEPLKVEHNGFYYDFNCHQSKAQNQTADKEFDHSKKTIKLI